MREYHKIQSIYKRDEKTHRFIEGQFSLPEFEYLKDNVWGWTEKIDGTNVRVFWDGENVQFGGRTANAQMPVFLYDKLNELFPAEKFKAEYPDSPMCLYGEGYGAKIQKGGGNYIPNGVDFILFDVMIDTYWLKRQDAQDIASHLGIRTVPLLGTGNLAAAIEAVRSGFTSTFGPFLAEGMILKPSVDLFSRNGQRVITKIKHRDW